MEENYKVAFKNALGISQFVQQKIKLMVVQSEVLDILLSIANDNGYPLCVLLKIDQEANNGKTTSVAVAIIDMSDMADKIANKAVDDLLNDLNISLS